MRLLAAGVLLAGLCGAVSHANDSKELRSMRDRFFNSLAWVTLMQEQCNYWKTNHEKIMLVSRDLGLTQADLRPGGRYFERYNRELRNVKDEFLLMNREGQWTPGTYCKTAEIMFGPEGDRKGWMLPVLPEWAH